MEARSSAVFFSINNCSSWFSGFTVVFCRIYEHMDFSVIIFGNDFALVIYFSPFFCSSCSFQEASQKTSKAPSLPLLNERPLVVSPNRPSRDASAALLSALPFKPSLMIFFFFYFTFLMDCFDICVSLLPEPLRAAAAFLGQALLAPNPASPLHQAFCLHPCLPLPSIVLLTLLAQVQWL